MLTTFANQRVAAGTIDGRHGGTTVSIGCGGVVKLATKITWSYYVKRNRMTTLINFKLHSEQKLGSLKKMLRFKNVFPKRGCSAIGMIHVGGLPGTPRYDNSCQKLIDDALRDAEIYRDVGIDGILVENMNDIPYIQAKDLQPETTAMMTRICSEVRKIIPEHVPCGVQVLAGGNRHALAVAQAANFQFIRAEGFVFSHVADEGFIDACAGSLLRYRRQIGANDILVFADIKKKHSAHSITADVSLSETAKAAEFFLANGVILTGTATGEPADESELTELLKSARGPVIVGSGVDKQNLKKYIKAHGVIVGSHFKVDGQWQNSVDATVVRDFMKHLSILSAQNY